MLTLPPGAVPPAASRRRLRGGCRAVTAAVVAMTAVATVAGLSGCGDKRAYTHNPVAARVNGDEVLAQQVANLVQQQRVKPEQAEAQSRLVLERLIDQQLVLQQAESLRLAEEPRVAQQLEAARREVLTRALADKLVERLPAVTEADIQRHYDSHPAQFAQRRIYQVQELLVEVPADQLSAVRAQLAEAADVQAFVAALRARGLRPLLNQFWRPAEQWPAPVLAHLQRLQPGQHMLAPAPGGLQMFTLLATQDQPLTLAQARPLIEQQLLPIERRRQQLEAELRRLRGQAKLEYLGQFARPAAAADAASTATAPAAPAASAASSAG